VAVLNLLAHLNYLSFTFEMVLFPHKNLKQIRESILNVHLDESEFLIALVLQNLAKQSHLMVVLQVGANSMDDSACPFYDERLQPILLVEVSVHELLHCFNRQLRFSALDIIFHLLSIDVINDVFQLLQRENLVVEIRDRLLLSIKSSLEIAQVLILRHHLLQTSANEIVDLRLAQLLTVATKSISLMKRLSLLIQ
jgi:hypothetical protein